MNAETPFELVSIEPKDALAIFTTDNPEEALAPTLAKVRSFIDGWTQPDVTTEAGRKEIASMAYKVTRSKGVLEKIGKELAAEAKKVPGRIDATRRHVEKVLDGWRDEVRAPLDAWEKAEQQREDRLQELLDRATLAPLPGASADWLRAMIGEINAINPADGEEFAGEVEIAKAASLTSLKAALATREQADKDAAELAALRREKEEREARERAEREAKEKADAEARREQELKDAAEKAATAAAAKAKADLEAKQKAEEEAERKRAANTAHRRKVNRAAVADLVAKFGLTEVTAQELVTMIAKGEIAHVTIQY